MPGDGILDLLEQRADALAAGGLAAEVKGFESRVLGIPVVALSRRRPEEAVCPQVLRDFVAVLPNGCLLSCRLSSEDLLLRESLETAGFHFVECYLSLRHGLSDLQAPQPLPRHAAAADLESLRALAAASFSHSRWHCDRLIPKAAADESRALWVENALRGRAEAVYATEDTAGVNGFVCCMAKRLPEGQAGVLDLIAVAARARGQGFGRSLVRRFLSHCAETGKAFGDVGTQAHNSGAVRLYESEGFRLNSVHYTYHLHVD